MPISNWENTQSDRDYNAYYREDYETITSYFSADYVKYEDTIEQMKRLADKIEKFSMR